MSDIARDYFASLRSALAEGPPPQLTDVVDALFAAFLRPTRVYTFGNGASAALAAHMACDLGRSVGDAGSLAHSRLRIASLSDNAALVTATANDNSYDQVFVEQLRSMLDPEDVLIGISASGTSRNVLYALDYARACGATTIGFTGSGPGVEIFLPRCDIAVQSPTTQMEQTEDIHVSLHHVVTLMLRRRIAEYLDTGRPYQTDGDRAFMARVPR